MTGKEVIDFIQENRLENAKIVLVNTNSLWQSERIEASNIEVETTDEDNAILLY